MKNLHKIEQLGGGGVGFKALEDVSAKNASVFTCSLGVTKTEFFL